MYAFRFDKAPLQWGYFKYVSMYKGRLLARKCIYSDDQTQSFSEHVFTERLTNVCQYRTGRMQHLSSFYIYSIKITTTLRIALKQW